MSCSRASLAFAGRLNRLSDHDEFGSVFCFLLSPTAARQLTHKGHADGLLLSHEVAFQIETMLLDRFSWR